jgi:putative oxidoreductase
MPMDLPIPSRFERQLLTTLRIVTALLFLERGMMKLFDFPAAQVSGPLPPLLVLAALIEIATGTLILLGLFTRTAAFIASGEMAVAYFMAHFPHSFWPGVNMGDAAILFCFIFLYLASAGGGAWSIDRVRSARA